MRKNERAYRMVQGKNVLTMALCLIAVLWVAPFTQAGGKKGEDKVDASNAYAYFCGKRGDLTAPQCAVLLGEYTMNGHKGHVFVCSKDDRTFGCVSGLCEELSTFVSRIEMNYTIDQHKQLCDLLCGPCKGGWR